MSTDGRPAAAGFQPSFLPNPCSLPILTVGDARLEQVCDAVRWPDPMLELELQSLQATLEDFHRRSGFGRAIAAPQVGILKRLIALRIPEGPAVLINPVLTWCSDETFEVWDDCLSVPEQLVRVTRHRHISLRYQDVQARWQEWWMLPEALSELVQHELDHLDGILMTRRAVDGSSLRPASERASLIDAVRGDAQGGGRGGTG